MFYYATDCSGLSRDQVPALEEMKERAIEITYGTMRRHCVDLLSWAEDHCYDRYLPLSKDWHVGYYKSQFEGKPCYFLVWSGFECIWLSDKE